VELRGRHAQERLGIAPEQETPVARQRFETLKKMHLTTDLREDAEIFAPEGDGWRPVALRLRDLIRETTGQDLPIHSEDAAAIDGLNARHWVLLGSAMNNPALMSLYRRRYAFADDFYPGGDGYVLRTVHNPENRGHNALIVGASRPEGAAAGLARLEKVFAESGPRLGYTNVARSETHAALVPDLTPEAFRRQMEQAFAGNAGRAPIERGIALGLAHHLTHNPDCARMFRDVLFYYEDLVHNRYAGKWCFEHMLFIYAWTWKLFYVWDLIEESDAFTDAERLRMTNLLWGLTHYVAGLRYFAGEEPPGPEIRQNHPTYASLSMSFSAGYFQTYYGIHDFAKELRFCRAIFDGQADCYKPNDDGGGSGYCWLVPDHLMLYDFRRDSARFLENGHLKQLADYAVQITDNLGSLVGFGDVGTYARRRNPGPLVMSTLCKAAWHHGDGAYLWAMEWMGGTTPAHGSYYKELPRRVPEHLTGISVAPFNPPLYEWAERHGLGGANVPLAEAFDKLALRGGFDEADEYLLLDGTSTYAHGHEDGNSIERLTWKGRMWLAETDYIWKRPRHHSSVVSICDGESVTMPSLVALKWAERFGSLAFTRTSVPAYNGVDWTRDLVWLQGRFILAMDTLALLKEADYDLRCLWRTLGDVRQQGEDLLVEQAGVFFRIRNADDAEKTLETEESRVAGRDPYEAYEFADGPIRIFQQRKTLRGRPGAIERYLNLLVAGTREEVDAYRLTRLAEGTARVEGPDGALLFGAAEGGARLGDVAVTAAAFAVTETSLYLLNGTRLSAGSTSFESDAPVHLALFPAEGRGEIRLPRPARVTLRGLPGLRVGGDTAAVEGRELAAGSHAFTFDAAPLAALREAVRAGDPYSHQRPPKQDQFAPVEGVRLRTAWETALTGAVSCTDARDGQIAAGTAAGQVALMERDGRLHWTRDLGTEVRTVHLADLDGDRALLAGGRDCALTRFDGEGVEQWKRPFTLSHTRDQIVNAVRTADLTGDGRTEIVVATDGWLVWALTPAGEEIWQRQIEHHAAQTLVIADVEGDGRQEILVGTEYHTSNMLEADGRIRWTTRGGPCFTALALADLNGDGVRETFYGAMDGNVYALDSVSGKPLWTANLGDDVRHGIALAGGAPAFVAGSESGNVALLRPDGRKEWRRDLGAPVTGLALLGAGDAAESFIAAGTAAGWIVLLNRAGESVGSHRLPAGVTALRSFELAEGPGLVVGTAGGCVTALLPL